MIIGSLAACTSTTVIQSNPSGARVLLNGAMVGNTPYSMSDTKIVGSSSHVRLEYPGYQPLDVVISRDEELEVGALIAGIFLLVPFLWIMRYRPVHMYELQPAAAGGYPAQPGWGPPPGAAPPPQGYPPPQQGYPPPGAPPPQQGYPPPAQPQTRPPAQAPGQPPR